MTNRVTTLIVLGKLRQPITLKDLCTEEVFQFGLLVHVHGILTIFSLSRFRPFHFIYQFHFRRKMLDIFKTTSG